MSDDQKSYQGCLGSGMMYEDWGDLGCALSGNQEILKKNTLVYSTGTGCFFPVGAGWLP